MTLIDLLEKAKNGSPDKVAFVCNDRRITYQELYTRVEALGANLAKLGVKREDRVAILLLNSIEFVISYFAIVRLGAIVVPINHMLKVDEVHFLLEDAGVETAICSTVHLEMLGNLRSRIDKFKNIILVSQTKSPDTFSFADFTSNSDFSKLPARPDPGDVAVVLYTSGTTGKPKGAMLTHKNLVSNVDSCLKAIELKEEDSFVCLLPMFHSFAWTVCVLMPVAKGCSTVIIDNLRSFTKVLRAVIKNNVTIFTAIPSIFNILSNTNLSEKLLSYLKVRVCISGAAALPVEVLERFNKKFGEILLEGYGLTEASPVVSLNPLKKKRKAGSIGLPIAGVKYKVVDDNGNDLAVNSVGELLVKGPNVMKGYFNLAEATAETIKDGWLYTGDMAKIDDENYAYIVDRKKDMVNVRGLNVYPREVEEVIYRYEKIMEAAVVGMLDKHKGEVPKAFVVLKPQTKVTEREIINFCRQHLADYKVPRTVEFRESLPKNSTGKILKRLLKDGVKNGKSN
jgi:long-chain acyl-CoA synthetase